MCNINCHCIMILTCCTVAKDSTDCRNFFAGGPECPDIVLVVTIQDNAQRSKHMNDWAGLQVNELAPHVERKCVAEGRCGGRLAYPAAAAASSLIIWASCTSSSPNRCRMSLTRSQTARIHGRGPSLTRYLDSGRQPWCIPSY